MCLILFAVDAHPKYPLILAANRDEFYGRPTQRAGYWEDAPDVLAGRDLEAGGTWCGISTTGRIAAVTNYREPVDEGEYRSRGDLVADFLKGDEAPLEYARRIVAEGDAYRGFNLLIGSADGLVYCTNRSDDAVRSLGPGVYGLSNHLLDTPWFKVRQGKVGLQARIDRRDLAPDSLFDLLTVEDLAPDEELPATGFGNHWERILSSAFIRSEEYGTRSSTVILMERDRAEFHERVYEEGEPVGGDSFEIGPFGAERRAE